MPRTREEISLKAAFIIGATAGAILLAASSIQATSILIESGFHDIFSEIHLGSHIKVQLALYLTFPMLGASFIFWGSSQIMKGLTKRGSFLSLCGGILALISLFLPQSFGFKLSLENLFGTIIAAALTVALSLISFRTPSVHVKGGPVLTTTEVATVGIFSAMTAVLTGLVGGVLPSPTGGYTHLGDTIIFMAALLFGCKVGAAAGIIGSVVADLYVGYSRWFVSIPAHGIEGALAGLARGKSTVMQIILCALGGFIMATVYFYVNIFIKGYPIAIISYVRDLIGQAGTSIVFGVILTKIVEKTLPQLKR